MAITHAAPGSSFAGKEAGKYISAALLSANTLGAGLLEIRDNVKYREVIQKISTGDLIQDASCDFNASGDVTLSEIELIPTDLMVNLSMCTKELENSWESLEMGMSAHNDELPKTFEDFVIGHVIEKVSANLETMIWQGTAGAGSFAGIQAQLAADTDVVDVTAAATVDASNIVEELGNIVDAIPATVYSQTDKLVIAVSADLFRAYKRALGGFQSQGQGSNGFEGKGFNQNIDVQYFDGIPVVLAQGLGAKKAVAYHRDNIFFGTGLLNDTQEVRVINMAALDGSQNIRLVMRFTAGVVTGIGSDIVYYS